MRVVSVDSWICDVYLDASDLEGLSTGEHRSVSLPGRMPTVIIEPVTGTDAPRIERVEDGNGRFFVPYRAIEQLSCDATATVDGYNAAFPLRITLRPEPGVAAPDWWTNIHAGEFPIGE